jgi:hypothetical protein
MKVNFKVNNKVTVTAEGETQLEVFEQLGSLQEVFGEEKCGKCGGDSLAFRVRHVTDGKKEYTYPEMQCRSPKCFAKLSFGQQMESKNLFPKRKNEDGTEKGKRGWVIYNKETGKEE